MVKAERVVVGKKPFYKKWWVWVLAVIIVGAMANSGDDTASEPEKKAEVKVEAVKEEPVEKAEPVATEPVEEVAEPVEEVEEPVEEPVEEVTEPSLSVSQEQAVSKAEDYLNFTAFSKSGLIEQLKFDGFNQADATFAVNNISVDWKEQAEKKAKDYLDFTSFSKSGLIEQLKFDGFSNEEASYGVSKTGL